MNGSTQNAASPDAAKRRVHHAYIWLGGIAAAFWMVVAFGFAGIGIVGELLEDGSLNPMALDVSAGAGSLSIGMSVGLIAGGIGAIVVLAAGIAIGFRALAYKHLWYELDASELSVYSGILSKKRTHVPYQKIQSVDLKAPLVKRVLGLCDVVVDTAGGAANKAVVIPYLSKQDAQTLQRELYTLKAEGVPAQAAPAPGGEGAPAANFAPPSGQPLYAGAPPVAESNVLDIGSQAWDEFGGVFASGPVEMEAPSYEYGLTNKEIVLAGMSNSSGVIGGIVGAVVSGIALVAPMLAAVGMYVPDAYDSAAYFVMDAFMGGALGSLLPVALLAVVGIALVIWVIASLATCIQYGGFRARRRGTRIEVELGLLQHNSITLDVERVQSVVVKQSFIRRIFGYCELSLGKVNAAQPGNDSNSKAQSDSGCVIHPFVKLDRVDGILHGMIPEYANLPKDEHKVAPVALRRGIVRRCILFGGGFWLAVVAAAAQLAMHAAAGVAYIDEGILFATDAVAMVLYMLAVLILVVDAAAAVLWFRDSRFALDRGMVSLTNGGLSKNTVAIPRTKVQFATAKTNPLQRRAKTATVAATTAAGIGGTSTSLIDVSADMAETWLAWAEPRRSPEGGMQ